MSQPSTNIPLIDFSQFSASPQEREVFLSELRYAAREIGFFYQLSERAAALTS